MFSGQETTRSIRAGNIRHRSPSEDAPANDILTTPVTSAAKNLKGWSSYLREGRCNAPRLPQDQWLQTCSERLQPLQRQERVSRSEILEPNKSPKCLHQRQRDHHSHNPTPQQSQRWAETGKARLARPNHMSTNDPPNPWKSSQRFRKKPFDIIRPPARRKTSADHFLPELGLRKSQQDEGNGSVDDGNSFDCVSKNGGRVPAVPIVSRASSKSRQPVERLQPDSDHSLVSNAQPQSHDPLQLLHAHKTRIPIPCASRDRAPIPVYRKPLKTLTPDLQARSAETTHLPALVPHPFDQDDPHDPRCANAGSLGQFSPKPLEQTLEPCGLTFPQRNWKEYNRTLTLTTLTPLTLSGEQLIFPSEDLEQPAQTPVHVEPFNPTLLMTTELNWQGRNAADLPPKASRLHPSQTDGRFKHCDLSHDADLFDSQSWRRFKSTSFCSGSPEPAGFRKSIMLPEGESESEDESSPYYSTPFTSPDCSPLASKPSFNGQLQFENELRQLDGEGSGSEAGLVTSEKEASNIKADIDKVALGTCSSPSKLNRKSSSGSDADADAAEISPQLCGRNTQDITSSPCDIPHLSADFQIFDLNCEDEDKAAAETPSVSASPAKQPTAFPFPIQSNSRHSSVKPFLSRHPSALLGHSKRDASPRQTQLMKSGISSLDRFIPNRACTPDRDAFMLQRPLTKRSIHPAPLGIHHLDADPFGPTPRRSLRMAEQYATMRGPAVTSRSIDPMVTGVPEARSLPQRSASAGTIWAVGGSVVAEGVASVSNGRGGRVTSGSNAAHYFADFLRRHSPSEDEIMHSRRLAVAMDMSPTAKMLSPVQLSTSSGSSSPGLSKRVFRDGRWETDMPGTPTKERQRKTKDIPIIPFRVLDAPSLRDDFYCSLLSYSPTVDCLAVGLGPHIYLWSENRGRTNIPDSLTAAFGSAHVSSVSFSSVEGGRAILAIGRADGRITLWSPLDNDPRFDSEHPAPVSCVAFRPNPVRRPSVRDEITNVFTEELLVGDELGFVYYYSVEWPQPDQRDLFDWHGSMTLLARIASHTQQVCGIAWSSDGEFFATGGNDNHLFLYHTKSLLKRPLSTSSPTNPPITISYKSTHPSTQRPQPLQPPILEIPPGREKHCFTLNAAVKAIAFAPWQPNLLAAGGGSNDRCIHFFHAHSGARLATIDCYAQVTALVWSPVRREIAATFGFAQPEHAFRVAVFAWPRGDLLVAIPWWSEERALCAVAYPRGPSAAATGTSPTASTAASASRRRGDSEGRPWSGRRTREEGCLVVATSDASIKFHEIWAERPGGARRAVSKAGFAGGAGALGGCLVLEDECSEAMERREGIR